LGLTGTEVNVEKPEGPLLTFPGKESRGSLWFGYGDSSIAVSGYSGLERWGSPANPTATKSNEGCGLSEAPLPSRKIAGRLFIGTVGTDGPRSDHVRNMNTEMIRNASMVCNLLLRALGAQREVVRTFTLLSWPARLSQA